MNTLVEKLAGLEKDIADERGAFALFGLFLREDVPDRWDLVVSAPWFGENEKKTLDYLSQKIQSRLKPDQVVALSRIVVVAPDDPSVKAIQGAVRIEHGAAEMRDCVFFGLPIKHAYIITSQPVNGAPVRAEV
jgi:hypothetical protein